ncbi:MAG: phage major capsid protein [Alphaproteobacteria bacterium]|nr:phage major capsid protein [Alphaproteobacteria bacterium]
MANSDYNDIFTTTLKNRSGQLADVVSNNNALLKRLQEKGHSRNISGGSKIVEELEYGQGDMTWYSGYDTIEYTPKQLFTAAEYSLKLCAVPVAISGEDMLKNSGHFQMMDLFEKRIENAVKTMSNKMAEAVYGDGTSAGGKAIGGLKLLIADAPETGVVGGIDRSTAGNEFWRNKSTTVATPLTTDSIRPAMDKMYMSLNRGTDKPDLIVTGNDLYSLFEQSLTAQQRFTDSKLAEAGFETLRFKGADVVCDAGQGGCCPEDRMYFLNTNYLYLRSHQDRNMKVIGGERMSINQDAIYKIIGWAGNMTMSNAALQGVLINNAE